MTGGAVIREGKGREAGKYENNQNSLKFYQNFRVVIFNEDSSIS